MSDHPYRETPLAPKFGPVVGALFDYLGIIGEPVGSPGLVDNFRLHSHEGTMWFESEVTGAVVPFSAVRFARRKRL